MQGRMGSWEKVAETKDHWYLKSGSTGSQERGDKRIKGTKNF